MTHTLPATCIYPISFVTLHCDDYTYHINISNDHVSLRSTLPNKQHTYTFYTYTRLIVVWRYLFEGVTFCILPHNIMTRGASLLLPLPPLVLHRNNGVLHATAACLFAHRTRIYRYAGNGTLSLHASHHLCVTRAHYRLHKHLLLACCIGDGERAYGMSPWRKRRRQPSAVFSSIKQATADDVMTRHGAWRA